MRKDRGDPWQQAGPSTSPWARFAQGPVGMTPWLWRERAHLFSRFNRPVLLNQRQSDALVVADVVGDEDGWRGEGVRGDEHVHLADQFAGAGQLVAYLSVEACRSESPRALGSGSR